MRMTTQSEETKHNKHRRNNTLCLYLMHNTQAWMSSCVAMFLYIPCAILLCGCDNTVVDRHGPLDRLADWYHHLLLVLLLHHLLIFICHWYLPQEIRKL